MANSTDYAAELTATAANRQFRIRRVRGNRNGKLFIERQNQFDGTWKLEAYEGSDKWYTIQNMVRRGWAVLASNEE